MGKVKKKAKKKGLEPETVDTLRSLGLVDESKKSKKASSKLRYPDTPEKFRAYQRRVKAGDEKKQALIDLQRDTNQNLESKLEEERKKNQDLIKQNRDYRTAHQKAVGENQQLLELMVERERAHKSQLQQKNTIEDPGATDVLMDHYDNQVNQLEKQLDLKEHEIDRLEEKEKSLKSGFDTSKKINLMLAKEFFLNGNDEPKTKEKIVTFYRALMNFTENADEKRFLTIYYCHRVLNDSATYEEARWAIENATIGLDEENREFLQYQLDSFKEGMKKDLSFETFRPGEANEQALKYARTVVEEEGGAYNPFYLYGGNGVGKSHLANAIKIDLRKQGKKVYHVGAPVPKEGEDVEMGDINDRGIEELILNAVKEGAFDELKKEILEYDALIIDDIQMIGLGKSEVAQEKLIEIMDAMYEQKKQMVFTGDVHPSSTELIEGRMNEYYNKGAGLIATIGRPDSLLIQRVLDDIAKRTKVKLPDFGGEEASTDADGEVEIKGYHDATQVLKITDDGMGVIGNAIRSGSYAIRNVRSVQALYKQLEQVYVMHAKERKYDGLIDESVVTEAFNRSGIHLPEE